MNKIPDTVETINALFDSWHHRIATEHVTKLTVRPDNPIDFSKDLWDERQIPALLRTLRRVFEPFGIQDVSVIVADYLNRSAWTDIAFVSVPLVHLVNVHSVRSEPYHVYERIGKTVQRKNRSRTMWELSRSASFVFFGRMDKGPFRLSFTQKDQPYKEQSCEVSGHFPLLYSPYNLRETTLHINRKLRGSNFLIGLLPQVFSFSQNRLLFPNFLNKWVTWTADHGRVYYSWKAPHHEPLPEGDYPLFHMGEQTINCMCLEVCRELYEADDGPVYLEDGIAQ